MTKKLALFRLLDLAADINSAVTLYESAQEFNFPLDTLKIYLARIREVVKGLKGGLK